MTPKFLYNRIDTIFISKGNILTKRLAIQNNLFIKNNKPDMFKYLELAQSFNFVFNNMKYPTEIHTILLSRGHFDNDHWYYSLKTRNKTSLFLIYWNGDFGWGTNKLITMGNLFTMLDNLNKAKLSLEAFKEITLSDVR